MIWRRGFPSLRKTFGTPLVLIPLLVLPIAAAEDAASSAGSAIPIGTKHRIFSRVLNQEREYWIGLPASYNDRRYSFQKYPVLILLDGVSTFVPFRGVLEFMSGQASVNYQVPEMIVAGVLQEDRVKELTPNFSRKGPDGREPEPGRADPYDTQSSGGGEKFLEFLEKELLPEIESRHRTLPFRVLVGHSLGGLTAVHAVLKHPGLFDAAIAVDPSLWWDGASLVESAGALLDGFPPDRQCLYLTLADNPGGDMSFHARSIRNLAGALEKSAPAGLRWGFRFFENTDHSSIPLLSWYYGLLFVFQGYELNLYAWMKDLGAMEEHFRSLETTIGLKMPPPLTLFEILNHYLTNRFVDYPQAVRLLETGKKYYPDSDFIYENLGRALALNGEKDKAAAAYEKALALNPDNQAAREKLKEQHRDPRQRP